jgi:hypothetical protein
MRALDHLVVTAPTREAGVAWVEERLGARMQAGGEHVRMGTHNALLRLGERLYLEVIAVNPAAAAASRPRWFGLDALPADAVPRLATWVARTDSIMEDAARLGGLAGEVLPMSRGSLSWLITVPPDGVPPFDGLLPALIQWSGDRHPVDGMVDSGCRLRRIAGGHPDAGRLGETLTVAGLEAFLDLEAIEAESSSWLAAEIETPSGLVVLGGERLSGGGAIESTKV